MYTTNTPNNADEVSDLLARPFNKTDVTMELMSLEVNNIENLANKIAEKLRIVLIKKIQEYKKIS